MLQAEKEEQAAKEMTIGVKTELEAPAPPVVESWAAETAAEVPLETLAPAAVVSAPADDWAQESEQWAAETNEWGGTSQWAA